VPAFQSIAAGGGAKAPSAKCGGALKRPLIIQSLSLENFLHPFCDAGLPRFGSIGLSTIKPVCSLPPRKNKAQRSEWTQHIASPSLSTLLVQISAGLNPASWFSQWPVKETPQMETAFGAMQRVQFVDHDKGQTVKQPFESLRIAHQCRDLVGAPHLNVLKPNRRDRRPTRNRRPKSV
jgi:hypothetical protein